MFIKINEVNIASCTYFLCDSYALCGKLNVPMRSIS